MAGTSWSVRLMAAVALSLVVVGCGDAILETAQPVRLRVEDVGTGKGVYGVTVRERGVDWKPKEMSASEWVERGEVLNLGVAGREGEAVTDAEGNAVLWRDTSRIAAGIDGFFDSDRADRVSGTRAYVGWRGAAGLEVGEVRLEAGTSVVVGTRRVTIVEVGPAENLPRETKKAAGVNEAGRPTTQAAESAVGAGARDFRRELSLARDFSAEDGKLGLGAYRLTASERWEVPANEQVRFDGNIIGLYLVDEDAWRVRAKAIVRGADGERVLVAALHDPQRYVSAHVMLSLLACDGKMRRVFADRWNGLDVSLLADGNVEYAKHSQEKLITQWGDRTLR